MHYVDGFLLPIPTKNLKTYRRIAMLALQIQTGQTKGFNPDAPMSERDAKIREWKQWLEQYRSNL